MQHLLPPKNLKLFKLCTLKLSCKKLRIQKFRQNWLIGSTLFGRQKFVKLKDLVNSNKTTFLTSSTKNAVETAILELQQF